MIVKKDIGTIVSAIETEAEALELIHALRTRFDMVGAELQRSRVEEVVGELIQDREEEFFGYEDRPDQAEMLLEDLTPGIADRVLVQEKLSLELTMTSAAVDRVVAAVPEIIDLQVIAGEPDQPYQIHLFAELDGVEIEVATTMHADVLEGHAWAKSLRGSTVSELAADGFQLNPSAPLHSIINGHAVGVPQVSEVHAVISFRSR